MRSARSVGVVLGAAAILAVSAAALHNRPTERLTLTTSQISPPADGREHLVAFSAKIGGRPVPVQSLHFSGITVESRAGALWISPAVTPRTEEIMVHSGKSQSAVLTMHLEPSDADTSGDGTPDYLRLHRATDRHAFRAWFTWLAEVQAAGKPSEVAKDIVDCAALLRYAYRESLRRHDDHWLITQAMNVAPPSESVEQWHYPETPLGDGLFRVKQGPYQASERGAFAQYADARSLMFWNTHLVARDVGAAQPGDILFYRQLEQNSQYHSMIVCGDAADSVVYHTGPIEKKPGEIRRMRMRDLLQHPDARWRPLSTNANFLGVYRWNILREQG